MFYTFLLAVKIYYPCLKSRCEQVCIPGNRGHYACGCNRGYRLARGGLACTGKAMKLPRNILPICKSYLTIKVKINKTENILLKQSKEGEKNHIHDKTNVIKV